MLLHLSDLDLRQRVAAADLLHTRHCGNMPRGSKWKGVMWRRSTPLVSLTREKKLLFAHGIVNLYPNLSGGKAKCTQLRLKLKGNEHFKAGLLPSVLAAGRLAQNKKSFSAVFFMHVI